MVFLVFVTYPGIKNVLNMLVGRFGFCNNTKSKKFSGLGLKSIIDSTIL